MGRARGASLLTAAQRIFCKDHHLSKGQRIAHHSYGLHRSSAFGACTSPFRQLTTQCDGENLLMKHLQMRIKAGGPLTVAVYMKEVLTNPNSGYYMHKDVFGSAGDYTTSPEISQMFGEMLGIWVVNEWMNNCNNQPLQIVELGPGRGTLADDMLRVFSQFPDIKGKISLHLVEVSPTLSRLQAAKLTDQDISDIPEEELLDTKAYRHLTTKYGIDVSWYSSITDVPEDLSCYVAHEFLDALPVHKFQKAESGWREVLVDSDPDKEDALRLVLAPGESAASVSLLKVQPDETRDHIEISPGAGLTMQEICRRIRKSGGMALLADYGHTGEKGDTLRGFKNHKLHDPLLDPGHADLTADVDFSFLSSLVSSDINVFGPITQEAFLMNMGIGVRLQRLLQTTNQEHWSSLISGFKMLTAKDQMGERFKFLALLGNTEENYKPAGFVELNIDNEQPNDKQTDTKE